MASSSSAPKRRIPVTVLTGFLGSGKTTLLNYVLSAQHGKKIAVIENEFGEVGIDDALVKRKLSSEEQIFEMNNGCICCTVRGDLIRILSTLLKSEGAKKLDAIFIETTGMADPAPVAQTFFVNEKLARALELDAIVTVIDSKHVLLQLDSERPEGVENEAVEQIAFADVILLNKTDLVSKEELETVKSRVRAINSTVEMIESVQSVVPLDKILNIKGFNLKKVLEMEPTFLEDQEHQHDQSVTSVGFHFEGDVVLFHLENFIDELMKQKGNDLFRYKGVLAVAGMKQKYIFQGVHMLFSGTFEGQWDEDELRESKFIFIGKNLDREELTTQFEKCKAKELRFAVGDVVLANTDKGWERGTVLKHWENGNAYRIRIERPKKPIEVWASADNDSFIKSIA